MQFVLHKKKIQLPGSCRKRLVTVTCWHSHLPPEVGWGWAFKVEQLSWPLPTGTARRHKEHWVLCRIWDHLLCLGDPPSEETDELQEPSLGVDVKLPLASLCLMALERGKDMLCWWAESSSLSALLWSSMVMGYTTMVQFHPGIPKIHHSNLLHQMIQVRDPLLVPSSGSWEHQHQGLQESCRQQQQLAI